MGRERLSQAKKTIRFYQEEQFQSVQNVKKFARDMGPSPKGNSHFKHNKPPHLVAPKLVLTPTGYCPVDEKGKVIQMSRGIRMAKSRQMPSDPTRHVNWYAPRG